MRGVFICTLMLEQAEANQMFIEPLIYGLVRRFLYSQFSSQEMEWMLPVILARVGNAACGMPFEQPFFSV